MRPGEWPIKPDDGTEIRCRVRRGMANEKPPGVPHGWNASQFAMLERTPDAMILSQAVRELATATIRAELKGHTP